MSITAKGFPIVSILARPEGRALHPDSVEVMAASRFQSSPAPKDGRYGAWASGNRRTLPFQSSPAPKDGRYWPAPAPHPASWFQSSPAPQDGRYKLSEQWNKTSIVSILARPEGRALHRRGGDRTSRFSFNPRPPRRTGATVGLSAALRSERCFNPRPPRRTGATGSRWRICGIEIGFNPRPPRRTGATPWEELIASIVSVSILARPEGRALHRPKP